MGAVSLQRTVKLDEETRLRQIRIPTCTIEITKASTFIAFQDKMFSIRKPRLESGCRKDFVDLL